MFRYIIYTGYIVTTDEASLYREGETLVGIGKEYRYRAVHDAREELCVPVDDIDTHPLQMMLLERRVRVSA